ncbi:MAG TPA: 3-phosphoshikimate 1-carboxyvinyltransferase [Candidatus Acidoferrales bacterium]|jgi:3-phosphoshikimate 1-carboxyvinyltransferase|nr:3-phosphoshikimate 1-carboxyvinyltransferase [Candidatus Acidoferrales bacterium]
MPLPGLIEIVPLKEPVRAEITVPGSKSITNRALILAALAEGEVTLTGALWSEDTQIMTEALQKLGFEIRVEQDLDEFCNRTITIKGLGGKIPSAGLSRKPLELFVGNAGTAARFLAALVCLGEGFYYLRGTDRMHERPQSALFKALRQIGYTVETEYGNDRLPATIEGVGPWPGGKCKVSIEKSSQFASALLLCAKTGEWQVKVEGENAEESPYVAMTSKMMEVFPHRGGKFQIEPDASSGSYFWAAGVPELSESVTYYTAIEPERFSKSESRPVKFSVCVSDWPYTSKWQIDAEFPTLSIYWHDLGHYKPDPESPPPKISRKNDAGDSIMTAIVLAPLALYPLQFTDLGRLRLQETERVKALKTELTKCGAKVEEQGDTLTIYPSQLRGAEIETYDDHRMAMCFAVLGLKVPGIKIKNPACVKKTFPNFFQKLATPPPKGLGVTILDAQSGRKLELNELFAD